MHLHCPPQPNEDIKGIKFPCTLKLKFESQNSEKRAPKGQLLFQTQTEKETSSAQIRLAQTSSALIEYLTKLSSDSYLIRLFQQAQLRTD